MRRLKSGSPLGTGDSFELSLSYTTTGHSDTTVGSQIWVENTLSIDDFQGKFCLVDASYYVPGENTQP
jgi:hypothetical protein